MVLELDRDQLGILADIFPRGNAARILDIITQREMPNAKSKALKSIREYHKSNPVDAAHDLTHHAAVVQNCIQIASHESLGDVLDLDSLEIAAWAHDIERDDLGANNKVVRDILEKSGLTPSRINRVIQIINDHSFGKKQGSLEARVLYDADKIEYVSLQRAASALEAVKDGSMTESKLNGYLEDWKSRIKDVRKSMHFESSRLIFDKKFKATAFHFKEDPLLRFMYIEWYNLYHAR